MRLSPDDMIFWRYGFLKLNGTIVFTWALMFVLAVGSKLVTRKLSTDLERSPWQNLLEIIVTGIEKQIADVKAGKTLLSFLGSGYNNKQVAKLEEERRKFGSLIEAPRWFYKQARVQLLSAIRDYALDGSQQGDATWTEIDQASLVFPIVQMFETADLVFAETLVAQLEKPLKDVDPRFLLEKFEGNRSISFDFEKNVAMYYTPAPAH